MEAVLAQLYFTTPAIADVANYISQTRSAEVLYLSNQLNHIFRDLLGGAILLFLTLSGLAYSILHIAKSKGLSRELSLLTLAGLGQFLALGLVVSLPFQRYCLPMVPYLCIWSGMALDQIVELVRKTKNHPLLFSIRRG
jgi:hypothetical protein